MAGLYEQRLSRLRLMFAFWPAFVFVGLVMVAGGIGTIVHDRSRRTHGPVLVDPTALAVADSGDFFVYTNWGEIRAFDADGTFLRVWAVDALNGGASLAIDDTGVLVVSTQRAEMQYRFDFAGRLLGARSTHGVGAVALQYRVPGPGSTTYEVQGNAVVRIRADGVKTTLVPGPPDYLAPFYRGLPRTLLLVQGALTVTIGAALGVARRRGWPPEPI